MQRAGASRGIEVKAKRDSIVSGLGCRGQCGDCTPFADQQGPTFTERAPQTRTISESRGQIGQPLRGSIDKAGFDSLVEAS
jgi:hypothetical protein